MSQPIHLHPMHQRPAPGHEIVVLMRDGQQLDCTATMVSMLADGRRGIIIYHQRKAIDESLAKGWWPGPRMVRTL